MVRFFFLFFLAFTVFSSSVRADDVDPLAGLASGDYDQVAQSIATLAQSGNPKAASIISALQNGRLYYAPDRTLLIKGDADTYTNALTGESVTVQQSDDDDQDAGPQQVRVNNHVRSAIDAAMGSLQLLDPDPAIRLAAAGAVFTAHNPAAIPALDKALGGESEPSVKRLMEQARAAALLSSDDASQDDKLAAVHTLRERGDIEARSLLGAVAAQSGSVGEAAATAVASIDFNLQIWSFAQSVYYGVSLGSVLLLAAAGLAITFGVMGVINMAHGEMVMLGAYVTFVVQQAMHAYLPSIYGASLIIAVPLAFLLTGLVGIIMERSLIRWLYGRPLETLLATWGLSLILQQIVRSIFGANNRGVDTPAWMSGATQLGGLTLTWNRMYIILFAFIVVAALMAALRFTPLGLRMRAVTQNRRMAAAMGIRTPWIDALTFGLGSGVAGMAGVALSQIDNVSPNLGQGYIIDSFMVVVFGGVGNLWGTTLGALTLGIVNKFLEPVAGAVLGKIVALVLLILFVQRNPRGMFPLKGRAVEA
ncbi:MAG: urea ABC transporter permease subunit UrtB [Rhodopila sp.]